MAPMATWGNGVAVAVGVGVACVGVGVGSAVFAGSGVTVAVCVGAEVGVAVGETKARPVARKTATVPPPTSSSKTRIAPSRVIPFTEASLVCFGRPEPTGFWVVIVRWSV